MEEVIISGAAVALDSNPMPAKSAASWPSIFAGAFVAAATSLILVALGSGLGFASISPWPNRGASITTFAITTAIWLIVTQWLSAALGGYIAGRLRTRWIGTHTHEVFFRDTAHGLVTWAVATVLVAAIAAGSFMSAAGVAGRAVADAAKSPVSEYSIDKLFRPSGAAAPVAGETRVETGHIVANALATGSVPDADRAYLVEQVSARTGMTQAYAQSRVDAFIASVNEAQAKLKADADAAKRAAAQAAIYLALSMLIGAFIASVSAALGGRLRDEHI
ncbi:MAG TPA: hypothetical protein VN815_18800 [Steroidobacteraceae bacterium]|jgi:hypothetical protein|nr:hypothetical protein [Steroidobacteraceae bacterium]